MRSDSLKHISLGLTGFGHSSRLRTWKILRLYEDLPLVVEIVDTEERIKAFLATFDAMTPSGPITLEKVQFLRYGLDSTPRPARREGSCSCRAKFLTVALMCVA